MNYILKSGRKIDTTMFEYEFDKYCDNIRDLQALYCHNDGEYRKLGKEELFEVMRYIYDRTWENKFK